MGFASKQKELETLRRGKGAPKKEKRTQNGQIRSACCPCHNWVTIPTGIWKQGGKKLWCVQCGCLWVTEWNGHGRALALSKWEKGCQNRSRSVVGRKERQCSLPSELTWTPRNSIFMKNRKFSHSPVSLMPAFGLLLRCVRITWKHLTNPFL